MSDYTEEAIHGNPLRTQLRNGFPWMAKAEDGRWFLINSKGHCLARFNLDTGHASRLAASAPELLEALIEARSQLEQYEFERTGKIYNSLQINTAIQKATGDVS